MWSNWAPSPSLLDVGDSLDDAVALAISNAYASSTLATRKSQALKYLRFCRLLQTSPFPISVRNLCRYCVYLSRTLKYSSIANYLDGLRWLHVMFDYPPPPISHCRVQLTLRGLKRLLSASVKRKLPITPTILLALRDVMDLSLPLHLAFWAAFLLGFFSFFRKSNIIPPSHSQFSPNKHLSRSDFYFTSWGLIVSVKWSKVNQFRERTLLIPLVSIPSHALCPVQALRKFFLQSCFCYPHGAWSSLPLLQLVHQTPKRSPWPCRFHSRRLFRTFISPWRSHLCKLPRYLSRINSTARRLSLYCLPRVPCETTPTALHLGRASCYSNCLLSVLPRS